MIISGTMCSRLWAQGFTHTIPVNLHSHRSGEGYHYSLHLQPRRSGSEAERLSQGHKASNWQSQAEFKPRTAKRQTGPAPPLHDAGTPRYSTRFLPFSHPASPGSLSEQCRGQGGHIHLTLRNQPPQSIPICLSIGQCSLAWRSSLLLNWVILHFVLERMQTEQVGLQVPVLI